MATSSNQGQRDPKRAKLDLSNILKPDIDPAALTLNSLLTSFKHHTKSEILFIESCHSHEHHDEYLVTQLRLFNAQKPHFTRLNQFRIKQVGADPPALKVSRQLGQDLAKVSQHPGVVGSVKDALNYYEAVCVSYSAFSQRGKAIEGELKRSAGEENVSRYLERLLEASERHLKMTIPAASASASASGITMGPHTEPSRGCSESFSDEYLKEKVSSFIVNEEELDRAIPWHDINDCESGLKKRLEMEMSLLKSDWNNVKGCPPGVLLHGDQGTGNTSIVESFAANYKLKMFKVGSEVHGSLRDQSEELIRYVFQAARDAANNQPCVVFFEEVDTILGGSDTQTSGFEGIVKQAWGEFIKAKVQCFIFGATNRPWLINMGDFSRHFKLKVHITMPGLDARKVIVKQALQEFWHNVDDQGLNEIAAASQSFSSEDIKEVITYTVKLRVHEMLHAQMWQKVEKDGSSWWTPVAGDGTGMLSTDPRELQPKIHRQITAQMVVDSLESGDVEPTTSEEVEKRHREWNAEHKKRRT